MVAPAYHIIGILTAWLYFGWAAVVASGQ